MTRLVTAIRARLAALLKRMSEDQGPAYDVDWVGPERDARDEAKK